MIRDDAELLRQYATEKSETAFGELVNRHVGFVYAVALRRTAGDAQLAEDVAQSVFTVLAHRAPTLAEHPALGAWLFRTTRFSAARVVRAKNRRERREQEVYAMQEVTNSSASEPDWSALRPVLDDALEELPERDRTAVWLRCCEGLPFAAIGAKLSASEDSVRVRVDRALEKMRVSLARRGVVSTTALLTSALAHEAGALAPVGLATTVAGAALANAAAGGSAVLGWATFMSTTKYGALGAAAALFFASLTGNAYLWARHSATVSPLTEKSDTAVSRAPSSTASTAAQSGAAALAAGDATAVSLVKNADLAALRDQLRSSGLSEAAVRATLEGILQRRYREQLSADRVARLRRGWWRDGQRTWGTENDVQLPFPDLRLMGEMVRKPLEELLGPDPHEVAAADRRYAFLPAALREELRRLDGAQIGGWSSSGQPEVDRRIEEEVRQNNETVAAERAKLMDALTREQRADYEIQLGEFGQSLKAQLAQVGFTDQEFRAVSPIADAYAKELATLQKAGTLAVLKADLDRGVVQQLIATFGFDRALDFIWASTVEYPAYARIAREAGLPPTTAGHVVQLAAETADRAAAIHADGALAVEQKRAALLVLQREVRPQLDALFPATEQLRLSPNALAWIQGLNEGQYKPIRPILPGQVRTLASGGLVSVDKSPPVDRSAPAVPLTPARPVGK